MALPDPIPTLTVNAVTYDFARIGITGDSSSSLGTYRTADKLNTLSIAHTVKNRERHSVRIDRKKVAANPFDSSLNQEYSWSVYTVLDMPRNGVSTTEAQLLNQLLAAFMVAGTPDYDIRVFAGEL